jgi:hypothetical protein
MSRKFGRMDDDRALAEQPAFVTSKSDADFSLSEPARPEGQKDLPNE